VKLSEFFHGVARTYLVTFQFSLPQFESFYSPYVAATTRDFFMSLGFPVSSVSIGSGTSRQTGI